MPIDAVKAGIDWLTFTLSKDKPAASWWLNKGYEHIRTVAHQGHELKQYRLNGYDGYGVGGCFVGERPNDYMVQFSGSWADDAFWALYRNDCHVSRIDLRVDVKYKIMPQTVARKGYRDAVRANNELPIQRRRKIYILMGSDGGDTLYVGSPSSDQRGRLYNKEIQSEDPLYQRTWRYECVYRNDAASRVATVTYEAGSHDFSAIRSIVATWYANRGISTRQFSTGAIITLPLTRTIPSDVEKRLVWLKTQVAPALRFLQEHGATTEMLEALGISPKEDD